MSTRVQKLRKIGENLRIYREASGRAIEVVANSLGVSVEHIRQAENGKRELTFVQYLGLSELYNVGFSAFFESEKGYFNAPSIPEEICRYLREQLQNYCADKHKTKKDVQLILGIGYTTFYYFFTIGRSDYLSPQTAENVIALLNLTSNALRSVCGDVSVEKQIVNPTADTPLGWRDPEMVKEQDIQEDFNHVKNAVIIDQYNKKPDERNATMDALTVVTDALAFYKKRNEVVAELERIIKVAQALIEEMKA